MRMRVRNSPKIEFIIREYLSNKADAASLAEITEYVQSKATILSKTPRNTIVSIIFRMPDVERVVKGLYKHVSN